MLVKCSPIVISSYKFNEKNKVGNSDPIRKLNIMTKAKTSS